MNVGKNIETRRKQLGWTQEELANRMGYKSKTSISKIEAGVNEITQSKIEEFANVLGVSIHYIMGWYEGDLDDRIKKEPTGEETGELSGEEFELIKMFRMVKPEDRPLVLSMIRAALSIQK